MLSARTLLYTTLYGYTTVYDLTESKLNEEFSEREKDIMHFVEKKEGCSKQDVVNALANKYSRVPILNSIDDLESLGMILVRSSEQNRQTKVIFTNDKSVLVTIFDQLNDFEISFFAFIDKLQATGKTKYPMPKGMVSYVNTIPLIYEHFLGMCLMHAFVTWPREIKDPIIAARLYNLLFSKLYEISVRLAESFEKLEINLSVQLLQRFWNLDPAEIEYFRAESKKHALEHSAEDILNQLWKLSKNYAPNLEWRFKKGFIEKLKKGEQLKQSMQVFDRLNDQLKYWNDHIDSDKKDRKG